MKIKTIKGKKWIRLRDAAKMKGSQPMSQARFLQMKEEKEWAWEQFQLIKKRCQELEQHKRDHAEDLRKANEAHANDALAAMLQKTRLEQLLTWVTLNKPELLKLERMVAKQAAQASANLNAKIVLNVTERKRKRRHA